MVSLRVQIMTDSVTQACIFFTNHSFAIFFQQKVLSIYPYKFLINLI
jgi:hypothetical protein